MLDASDLKGPQISELILKFKDLVVSGPDARLRLLNCEGLPHSDQLILRPTTESELEALVNDLYRAEVPYSAFSTGHNWGYGTSRSVHNNDVLIELSQLNRIHRIDEELGLIEIGPGVTQEQLARELKARSSQWMIPITGAGPKGSLLSNALERGFGLNPITDHFESLIGLRAILPNGETYSSALDQMGAHRSDWVSKWKVGPYLEGLFGQSSYGIVTRATLQLARKPISVHLLLVPAQNGDLAKVISCIQDLRGRFQSAIGGVNISNRARLEATLDREISGPTSSLQTAFEDLAGVSIPELMAVIPVYMYDRSQTKQISSMKARVRESGLKVRVLSEGSLSFLSFIESLIGPLAQTRILRRAFSRVHDAKALIGLLRGEPSAFTLKVAYSGQRLEPQTFNPAHDGVGLYWFAPILGLNRVDADNLFRITESVLAEYGQPAGITMTNFDQKLIEATIPIYFDPNDPKCVENARACWSKLHEEHLKVGLSPYRFSVLHMDRARPKGTASERLRSELKRAFDPKNLFCRGRY